MNNEQIDKAEKMAKEVFSESCADARWAIDYMAVVLRANLAAPAPMASVPSAEDAGTIDRPHLFTPGEVRDYGEFNANTNFILYADHLQIVNSLRRSLESRNGELQTQNFAIRTMADTIKRLEDARNVRRWIHDEVPAGTRATIGKLNRMDRVIVALVPAGAPIASVPDASAAEQAKPARMFAYYRKRPDENGGEEYAFHAMHHGETVPEKGERIVAGTFVPDNSTAYGHELSTLEKWALQDDTDPEDDNSEWQNGYDAARGFVKMQLSMRQQQGNNVLPWELTKQQIDAVWNDLGGMDGWLKTFGYQQFAHALFAKMTVREEDEPIVEAYDLLTEMLEKESRAAIAKSIARHKSRIAAKQAGKERS